MQDSKDEIDNEESGLGCGASILCLLVFCIFFGYLHIKDTQYRGQVTYSPAYTEGEIVAYSESSSVEGAKSADIEYRYTVEGKRYSRKVDISLRLFRCESLDSCSQKRFWVVYSTRDPQKSLINLQLEIQNAEQPEPSSITDDFI